MQARRAICTVLLAILLPIINLATPAQAGPPPPGPSHATLLEQLKRQTQGDLRIAYHAETGKVRFMGTSLDHPMAQPAALAAGASAEQAARGFLATYGQLFGLQDQAQELQVVREKAARGGRSFVRFQQMYQGIPVLGAELVVQVDAQGNVVSANGELLPGPQLDILPQIDAATARSRALSRVAKDHRLSPDDLAATPPELWVFNPLLLGGPGPHRTTLVWRMEVTALELLPIRELVLVDARQGFVALHFNQVDTARNRRTYDSQNTSALPGVLRRSEGQPPYGDSDVDKAHDYAGHVYDFYFTTHARDSLDNAGMTLACVVK